MLRFTWKLLEVNVKWLYLNVKRRIFLAKIWALHMHSLANLVVCTNLNFLLPKVKEKKSKNFVFFLSKITFQPGMPGSRKRGKRAKWIRWEVKRPGVAPCEGHFEIFGRKWQRQLTGFGKGRKKTDFFSQNLIVKTCKTPLCTPNNTGNNYVHHIGSAKPIPSWWKLAQNGKKCAKLENGVLRKLQVLNSCCS